MYSISENGQVRNDKTGRILKVNLSKGFKKVNLNGTNCHIHRLLAEAFIPNPNNRKMVVHIDGDKLNNDLSNLRWQDDRYNESSNRTEFRLKWIPVTTRKMTEEETNDFRAKYDVVSDEDCWVYSCSLPDDNEKVLVTTRYGDIVITTFCVDIEENQAIYWFEDYEDNGDIVAWAKLPEPYKKGGAK